MTKQQTAVEWLAERYGYVNWMRNRDEISAVVADEWRKHFLEQAKEMEKNQIKDAWLDSAMPNSQNVKYAEDYYNETYGDGQA